MYRKQILPKASPSVHSMPKSKEIAPSRSYGSLSSVVQRVQHNPNSVSEDERQQLESAIGSRSTKEFLAGKETPWVPEFQGISAQLWDDAGQVGAPIQAKGKDDIGMSEVQSENQTGLPDNLKAGIENLSGYSLDDVRVYYNSSKPVELQALAYTQGTDIYVAPGQEKHLPHETWHVVQQKQGRVKPTMQAKGVAINDDLALEREADLMGVKALQRCIVSQRQPPANEESSKEFTSDDEVVLEELGAAIQAKKKNASQFNGVVQRAYIARRPLGGRLSFGLKSRWFHNKGVFHEHIFFEDGKQPGNIGFHNGNPKLFQDTQEMIRLYEKIQTNLDDSRMRQAVDAVGDPGEYSLLSNNCQAYVEKVLRVYEKISSDTSGNRLIYESIGNENL